MLNKIQLLKKKPLLLFTLLIVKPAYAICPICTIAVGAGIGLSEYFGIDDTVTGLWIGGVIVSLIIWTIYWMDSKNYYFKGRKILVTLLYYLIIVAPLYYPMHLIGHPLNKLWGIDKLILGITLGSILFFAGAITYTQMKKHHNGRTYFPFQKVIQPIAPLIIFSIIFYFITR